MAGECFGVSRAVFLDALKLKFGPESDFVEFESWRIVGCLGQCRGSDVASLKSAHATIRRARPVRQLIHWST